MKNRHHTAIALLARLAKGPEGGCPYHAWYQSWIEDDLKWLLANDLKPKVGKPRLDFVNCRGE
jgi:hypothetical protein